MLNQFSRTQLLLGESALQELANKRVAVFGIGGVGGYACEALVRSGIGAFDLIDDDKVCLTNLNRQIIATRKTVGKYKTEVMKERMLEINPNVDVRIHNCFFLPENAVHHPALCHRPVLLLLISAVLLKYILSDFCRYVPLPFPEAAL